MSTKNKIISIAIIAALALGIAYGFYKIKKISKHPTDITLNDSQKEKMRFSDFIKQKGSYECTVQKEDGGVKSLGKIYVDDGKIRADFITEYNGGKIQNSAIIKDGFSYTWSQVSSTGTKIVVQQSGSLGGGFVEIGGKVFSFNADLVDQYDCKPWTPDSSKFSVPHDIEFRELELKG